MRITVRNLGVIKEAEFDLKPLTILVGLNNSGKTWLAYTLAGVLGSYGFQEYTKAERAAQVTKLYPPLVEAVDKLIAEGAANIDLLQLAEAYGEAYFNKIGQQTHEWLAAFMNTQLIDFSEFELSLQLADTKKIFLDHVLASPLQVDMGAGEQGVLLSVSKKSGQNKALMYTFSEGPITGRLPREAIERRLARAILQIIHQALFKDVIAIPAERTAIIASRFNTIINNLFMFAPDEAKEELISFPRPNSKPVSEYIASVIRAFMVGTKERVARDKLAQQDPQVERYLQLANLLEQAILGGTLVFSTPEPGPYREIIFRPESSGPVEISLASSMVKELTPLVFYLRYFAQPGELLVIDEPEMNLHPKAQAQMIEFLAMMVRAGLNVLMTTHSPYIVDHLVNMLAAARHQDQEAIREKFFLQDTAAFITSEQTSVLHIEDGTVKNIMDEKLIIQWDSFSDISDQVTRLFFDVYNS